MENKKNYAEVLESYMIAEEGFGTAALKVLGFTVKAIFALPFVIIGGVLIVSGIHCSIEAKKLRKAIKKNKGKAANYGSASWAILNQYAKDVIKIQEPKDFNKVIPIANKLLEFANQADNIRNEFIKLDPTNDTNNAKYQAILEKIDTLKKNVMKLNTIKIDSIDKTDLVDSELKLSNLMKMCDLEDERTKIIYKDTEDCQYIVPYYAYSPDEGDKLWDNIYDNKIAVDCVDKFDELIGAIESIIDTCDLIKFCNFAVNPKARPKK